MADEETPEVEEEVQDPSLDLLADLPLAEREEMQAALDEFAQQFAEPVEEDAPPEVEAEEEEAEEEPVPTIAAEVVSPQPPSARGVVVIDGVEVPVEEAVKYLVEQKRVEAQPKPEPVKPPEWLDEDDPGQVAMWTELQSLKAAQAQVAQNQNQIAQQQVQTRALTEIQEAMTKFAAGHPELSTDDIDQIRRHMVALNIVTGIHESLGGMNTPGAGTAAVSKALDIAYWDHPEFRAKAIGEPTPTEKKKAVATERKSKLNALGGSSGSTTRQEAKPDLSTDGAAKKAAAEWLSAQNIL